MLYTSYTYMKSHSFTGISPSYNKDDLKYVTKASFLVIINYSI